MNKYGKIAILQIMILLVGVVAFAYMIGIANIGLVSATPGDSCGAPKDSLCGAGETCGSNGQCKGTIAGGVNQVSGISSFFSSFKGLLGFGGNDKNSVANIPAKVTSPSKFVPEVKISGGKSYTEQQGTGKFLNTVTNTDGTKTITELNFAGKGGWQALGTSLLWAVGAALMVKMIAPMFGASEKQSNALALSIGVGTFVGKSLSQMATKGIFEGTKASWITPKVGIGIGVGVTLVMIYFLFKKEKTKKVEFKCSNWQPPTGGEKCEECNNLPGLPCSEYQCRSLGQACELLNKGTKKEKCAWVNPKDVEPPIISTWNEPLLEGYSYSPDSAINPPDRGVRIIAPTAEECALAFTPLSFGLQTNEPAICKISLERTRNFTDMEYFFGEELYLYNHTQTMALPGVSNAEQENITLENNGQFDLFVRCQDKNGNSNEANFVFKYCVDSGPDTTPVVVVDTNIINGMPVAVGQDSLPFELYINEPAECKWSSMDKDYDNMETEMDCSEADSLSDAVEINSRLVYTCTTTLEGIKDKQDNYYYFRCKDQPMLGGNRSGDRNTNAESYEMKIIGTQELVIDDAGPDGTVSDATEAVKVTLTAKTSAGFNEGDAICYYKDINSEEENYIEFFTTGSYTHSTDLFLAEEEYEYLIKCVDLGGNKDEWQVNFTVESDAGAPIVTRAYKEENYLKITTSEEAECVYDALSCNYIFEDGIPMSSNEETKNHFTDWNTKTKFYIKCRDDFGNQPPTDECSAIVRPI